MNKEKIKTRQSLHQWATEPESEIRRASYKNYTWKRSPHYHRTKQELRTLYLELSNRAREAIEILDRIEE